MSGTRGVRSHTSRVPAYLPFVFVLLAVVVATLSAVLVIRSLRDLSAEPKVWEYQGTTWSGDTCYVDGVGQLWCKGGTV